MTLGPSVSYKVGQKGLFGFLCYVAREIPNELFGQCNILPRMMEKQGEDRSGDGDLLNRGSEIIDSQDFDSLEPLPTPSSGVICSGWGVGAGHG